MPPLLIPATAADAESIAALRVAVAESLTAKYGKGQWSVAGTVASVEQALKRGDLYVARREGAVAATLILTTRKPWAIDAARFTPSRRPLYLTSMAVAPAFQRQGIGRGCLAAADLIARDWPAEFIRLDAFDAEAGAGRFYEGCGYRRMDRVVYRQTPLIYYERAVP